MFQQAQPIRGIMQRVTCTGHANIIQPTAATCKKVLIQARATSSGGALTANGDLVYVGIGADPGTGATFYGFSLAAGASIELTIQDVGMLYFRGANGDSVNIIAQD